jgi:hypothetical protein
VPEVEALLPRFRAAHTQVLGISVDSIYCHANWAESLGGISFPLLSDFQPKGAVADSFGLYLNGPGITDRATVIVDADGVVQHASSVSPSGRRNIAELAELCEGVDQSYEGSLPEIAPPQGLPVEGTLYVKSKCGFSRAALLAHANLHLRETVAIKNVSEQAEALDELLGLTGKDQAPCLVIGDQKLQDSAEIVRYFASCASDIS